MIVDLTPQIIADKEKKTLSKPFRTPKGPKKFSVYVKNDKGNIVKVNFGDPNMEIKETILIAVRVFAHDTTAITPAQNGRLVIGLAANGERVKR